MSRSIESAAREWVADVQDAYGDGGYASGDGPEPPLEAMECFLALLAAAEAVLAHHAWQAEPFDQLRAAVETATRSNKP